MQGLPDIDVRYVALPCVLFASVLQYMRFAKKPMAAPCHRLSDRLARRCIIGGLAIELAGLRLLPLCEAYPMNASCLVCLYFWKETKRSKSLQFTEVLACASALSAWLLPFVDPADGRFPDVMQDVVLLDALLSPRTCIYVVMSLVGGVAVHCQSHGGSALGSTAGPAACFGVSAIFLKALAHTTAAIISMPWRLELWAAVAALVSLLLWIRGAAATPLRRALEAHDKLSALASYGMTSSATAAMTGSFVFGETESWPVERQVLSFAVAAAHCWGMASLSTRGACSPRDDKEAQDVTNSKGVGGSSLQMSELTGRGSAGSSTSSPWGSEPKAVDKPPSPLLNFAAAPRTVDDDDEIEDQLINQALAAGRISSVIGEHLSHEEDVAVVPGLGADQAWGGLNFGAADGPQFLDSDFEELMRRFDEDDKKTGAQAGQAISTDPKSQFDAVYVAPSPAEIQGAANPAVVMDTQSLLDGALEDDEDGLLQSIQDIEDL